MRYRQPRLVKAVAILEMLSAVMVVSFIGSGHVWQGVSVGLVVLLLLWIFTGVVYRRLDARWARGNSAAATSTGGSAADHL